MAAGLDFEIEGLEELERDLTKAIQTAPEKAKETLKGIGKDFKNAAKKRANSELKPHERTGSEKNKAIKRKWGTKVIEENVGATQKRATKGESIENRPEEIDTRETFGHWEMDTVVGARGVSKKSLLVLTERKTRKEIIFLLKEHTAAAVVKALDRLERKTGAAFRKIFKTITVDNGSEFADWQGMERSKRNKKNRTKVYYCHPYSSWERGSNENQNKLVRRHIPKGVNFDDKTQGDIDNIAEWINNYPRRLFEYQSAEKLYNDELKKIAA